MNDILWKGIIQDLFPEFLRYFYPDWADKHVEWSKGYRWLDKELENLYPDKKGKRYADKLVEIHLKTGEKQWILVHIEVQGYQDTSFPERMFTYFYRIRDKYKNKKVLALAILTDGDPSFNPNAYQYDFYTTHLRYEFDSYKLLAKEESELIKKDNPFSLVMLSAYRAIGNQSDEQKIVWKIEMVRLLKDAGYSKETMRQLFNFIKYYANFTKKEAVEKFEFLAASLTENRKDMGIEESIIAYFSEISEKKGEKIGEEKGKKIGVEEERNKRYEALRKCLVKGMAIEEVAEIFGLPQAEVAEIAKGINL